MRVGGFLNVVVVEKRGIVSFLFCCSEKEWPFPVVADRRRPLGMPIGDRSQATTFLREYGTSNFVPNETNLSHENHAINFVPNETNLSRENLVINLVPNEMSVRPR